MLDNLANGPTFPPDPTPFSAIPRRQAVELMSQGSSVIDAGSAEPTSGDRRASDYSPDAGDSCTMSWR